MRWHRWRAEQQGRGVGLGGPCIQAKSETKEERKKRKGRDGLLKKGNLCQIFPALLSLKGQTLKLYCHGKLSAILYWHHFMQMTFGLRNMAAVGEERDSLS
jgi:hypothetical protein